ncbi:homoserine kinase [Leeia oryzae]|uniref:homoserine kinase n=1 Tax=Leeia oryzae TaxID=356662 RepID=UPI00037B93E3|nr:homoserine kinase [Leeia oryzae]
MSVFTPVSEAELSAWLAQYELGDLASLQGILAGIDNTNFFVTTTGSDKGHYAGQTRFVLTLFENLKAEQLPYNLELMEHLANAGLPAPAPIRNRDGIYLGELNGKPASLVTRLKGDWSDNPSIARCAAVGELLAKMHVTGQSYPMKRENTHGNAWRIRTAIAVSRFLTTEELGLMETEVALQATFDRSHLPVGAIHADLFRDNVLFDADEIGGVIDFYFACTDTLMYDVAITVNDWCLGSDYQLDPARLHAFISHYQAVRPFTPEEKDAWGMMLRAAALRFWLSRLYDYFLPRPAELNQPKDPRHFHRILARHAQGTPALPGA